MATSFKLTTFNPANSVLPETPDYGQESLIKRSLRPRGLVRLALLLALLCVSSSPLWAAEPPLFLTKWGTYGSGDGQFNDPRGVAVDSSGNVYVADTSNYRIQKFDSTGSFLTKWGSEGSGNGQFNWSNDIAVDSSGNVYVADTYQNRIQKFDSTGSFLTKWGSEGNGNGQFNLAQGMAVDSSGNVYVADYYNNRIQKFTSTGSFLTKWGSEGSGNGQFFLPRGVAVDSSGNVYVADAGNNRIQKFTNTGSFLTKWGTYGSDDGQFDSPANVAVDSSGNVYVTDLFNYHVQQFDSTGSFLAKWGSEGRGDGQFFYPQRMAVDSSGNVYVADSYNHRIQKFAPVLLRNSSVSQQSVTTSYNLTLCQVAGSKSAIYTITPTLRNISVASFTNLYFRVKTLEYTTAQGDYQPLLCNASSGNGGVGSTLVIPNSSLPGGNHQFDPAEDLLPVFQVGLPVRAQFCIKVDLYSTSVTAASGEGTAEGEYLGSFEYTFGETEQPTGETTQLFLPLVTR